MIGNDRLKDIKNEKNFSEISNFNAKKDTKKSVYVPKNYFKFLETPLLNRFNLSVHNRTIA